MYYRLSSTREGGEGESNLWERVSPTAHRHRTQDAPCSRIARKEPVSSQPTRNRHFWRVHTDMSDVPRSLQNWVSTIQSVVLTADVFQFFIKSKSKKGRKRKYIYTYIYIISTSTTQERRQHARRIHISYFRLARSAGGGVEPGRKRARNEPETRLRRFRIERENSPTILNSGHDSEMRTTIIQLSRQNLP